MADIDRGQLPERRTQTAALVNAQGDPVTFVDDHPIPTLGESQILAKILYTGVCQSDLHTARGTAAGPDGHPITSIKLPHCGGHEGVGRIIALGSSVQPIANDIRVGGLVGIRFAATVCHRCEACLGGVEQYCPRAVNHLHHRDGSFQEFVALDADYLTLLPDDCDPVTTGPTLCAGVTSYKAVMNSNIKPGQWLAVVGAAGGLGHFAIQYARAFGARVIAIDAGASKEAFTRSLGAEAYIDVTVVQDVVFETHKLTGTGAHVVVVTAGSAKAYANACDLLRAGGTLSCCGIAPGFAKFETPIAKVVIKNLNIVGNLIGSLQECLEAVDFVRRGVVKPKVEVRDFKDLEEVYERLEKGEIKGRIVLKVAED